MILVISSRIVQRRILISCPEINQDSFMSFEQIRGVLEKDLQNFNAFCLRNFPNFGLLHVFMDLLLFRRIFPYKMSEFSM